MGARSCCVLNCRRRSHDHRGRRIPNGLTFHRFPSWRRHEGEHISRLTQSRRAGWAAAVGWEDISFSYIPSSIMVCSRHFHSGKPSHEMLDPDWVPSLHLGPSKGNTRHTERLLQSVQRDQDQRRSTETRSLSRTPTAGGGSGPEPPAVRPWREVRALLLSALQHKTIFSERPVHEAHRRAAEKKKKKKNLDFRDFFRDALEASLEASSRSRTTSAPRDSKDPPRKEVPQNFEESSSSPCGNCDRLLKRCMELQEDIQARPVFTKSLLHQDQDQQSPEKANDRGAQPYTGVSRDPQRW